VGQAVKVAGSDDGWWTMLCARHTSDVHRAAAWDAPSSASRRSAPVVRGANEATKASTRLASSRRVHSVGDAIPANMRDAERAQRPSDAHPVAAVAPTMRCGLTALRTSRAVRLSTAHKPSASTIATAPYACRRTTPLGTTVAIASHRRHRYRRTPTVRISEASSSALGPSTFRSRRPCPTRMSRLPTGRLAAPQAGQRPGRAASHVGGAFIQDLTSISEWTIRRSLRVFSTAHAGRRRERCCRTLPSSNFGPTSRRGPVLRARFYRGVPMLREKTGCAMVLPGVTLARPSCSSSEIGLLPGQQGER
jgi:hypothetical protein